METLCYSPSLTHPLFPRNQHFSTASSLNNQIKLSTRLGSKSTSLKSSLLSSPPLKEVSGDESPPCADGILGAVPGMSPPDDDSLLELVSAESLQYESGFLGGVPEKSAIAGYGRDLAVSYLTRILSSHQVYDVAIESPLEYAPKLSEKIGARLWLKREDRQPIFSFKARGAYNMMRKLSREVLDRGVICSSAGNHAQGVALAANKLGCNAVIVMPVSTPEIKRKTVERLGAKIVLVGESYNEAEAYARERAKEEELTYISGFDHPDVIAGQGTIGMEITRQIPSPLHAIFVPVGGGGLIAGIAAYVKTVTPEVKVIGVEPYEANTMALTLHHGRRIVLREAGTFAEGVALKVIGKENFRLCKELIDGVVLVDRHAICTSIKDMFEETRSVLEPSGALAIAGAEAYCNYYGLEGGDNVVAITSGANINFDRLKSVLTQLDNVAAPNHHLAPQLDAMPTCSNFSRIF